MNMTIERNSGAAVAGAARGSAPNIHPTGSNVLLIMSPMGDSRKIGGLFIPDNAREKSNEGTVHAIGPKVTEVKVNERVLISHYCGNLEGISSELGNNLRLVREADILMVIG